MAIDKKQFVPVTVYAILGPVLFVMCINNLPGMSNIARFILYYAGDTNVQSQELPGYIYDVEQLETQSTLWVTWINSNGLILKILTLKEKLTFSRKSIRQKSLLHWP